MKVNLKRSALMLYAAVFSAGAFAHAGHDHEHWTSGVMHALFYASLVGCAAACGFAAYKYFNAKKRSAK
jgi:hydrogenase/urease accessory protein HupE